MMRHGLLGLLLALGVSAGAAAGATDKKPKEKPFAKDRIEWNKPQKPFPVIGNIYYVGMAGVSAFLIVTPEGDILTDGALPESAPFVEKNIAALGFKLSDIKILLNSHAHFDHSGGLAQLKRDSGARLYASAPDTPILESGHIGFGPAAEVDSVPVHVDHVVKDGGRVSLGGVTLTAHVIPGHTPGCTTWTMSLTDKGVRHHVMFFCSISAGGYPLAGKGSLPHLAGSFRASFAKLKTMDADVFLAAHGGQFHLADKLAKLKPGAPNPFIDAGEFHRFLAQAEKDFDTEFAKQKTPAKP
jgi:metallo-beta-lactamase class B